MNFQLFDWCIVAVYLAATVAIGLWAKRYVESSEGYFVAGRKLRVALGSATLVATEIGIVTFMYMGELGYVAGYSCFVLGIIAALAYFFIGKTGFIVHGLRRLRVITIPEFYELRYGRTVRVIGGIFLFLGGVLNMGVFLKMDGVFLSQTTGLGPDYLHVIMIVMLLIVVSYTVLGGMFSVVITDFIQFVVLAFSMLVATIFILIHVGTSEISAAVVQEMGEEGLNPAANPRFGWAFLAWVMFGSVAISALYQPATSRALAAESAEAGRRIYLLSGLMLAGRYMVPMFWGVAALAYFGAGEEGTTAMPKLLAALVPSGFLGLMIAGMLAASMSTYSSYMLAWSSVAARDIITPVCGVEFSEKAQVRVSRIITILIGGFILVFGMWYEMPSTVFQYTAITGTMYVAGAFGCVAFGLYWKKANSIGAYAALALGGIGPILFLVLSRFKEGLPEWALFLTNVNLTGFLSFFLAIAGMISGSLLTQRSHPPVSIEELERRRNG